ncbi:MAG TPA: phage holin family protein [Geminicoccus sp.]|uniref:phage holin family protein n=1 Tax=Geminicoccus sp. TaxID=2024832 RepID=UPI002C02AA0C|nr:phage holin family protein [Geminicoccus sp.]HWL72158.1 phage holin family protein [Geminicoccus sp.]
MWPLLRTFLPVDSMRPQVQAYSARLVAFAVAGVLGLIAFLYFLDAAWRGMLQVMPGWAASLVVGACLVIAAGLVSLIGVTVAKRHERRARLLAQAAPPPAAQFATIATPLAMRVLQHPRALVLGGLLAGAAMELFRKRR